LNQTKYELIYLIAIFNIKIGGGVVGTGSQHVAAPAQKILSNILNFYMESVLYKDKKNT
jgi:hypothetical protein